MKTRKKKVFLLVCEHVLGNNGLDSVTSRVVVHKGAGVHGLS